MDIPAGSRWDVEVEKALEASEIFMIIMTPTAIASENVRDEIGYAIDTGKRFLPVLLEKCNVPLRLRRFQYVDFTDKTFDEGVESAKELLRNLIAQPTIPPREIRAEPQDETTQAEAERKVNEAAKARAEDDRRAKEEANHLAAQKAQAEGLAQEQADAKRRAKAKAARERKAKEEVKQTARERVVPVASRAEAVPTGAMQTRPTSSNGLLIGIGVVILLIMAWLGYRAIAGNPDNDGSSDNESATEPPVAEAPATEPPAGEISATEAPPEPASPGERVEIRWFVGLGVGYEEGMIPTEQSVVDDFNSSQDRITLTLEVVPYEQAKDTLAAEFDAGNGPDIVGPVGFGGSHAFHGQWLDLSPYIDAVGFDTSIFEPALVDYFRTDEGQLSLPFAVHPAATYYVPRLFDETGLAYPPSHYGENYVLDGNVVDWNWDTLTEVARRLTIDANGINSTQDGFDRSQIVQIGFNFQWQDPILYVSSYRAGAANIVQNNQSILPDQWREALRWYYDGMWGDRPFMPTGALANTPEFGNGNSFSSGKVAMAIVPVWYTCCLGDFVNAGNEFQIGILPLGDDGQVHSHVDMDSFFIWAGTPHPSEAFEALAYLITAGGDKLLPLYNYPMSAIPFKNQDYFNRKSQEYPFVTSESWDVFQASLAYPDIPSADQYQPNYNEATNRIGEFSDLLRNYAPSEIDFDAEWQRLIDDLNAIYNR